MNSGHMPSRRPARANISVRVDADLAESVRRFVKDQAGKPLFTTLSSFCEDAMRAHLAALERKLAEGEPSPRTSPSRNSLHR
jgi:hypothetical protein